MGDLQAAADSMVEAIALSPPSVSLHYSLANRYLMLGDYARAEEQIRKLEALSEPSAFVDYSRGYLNLLRSDYCRANQYFEQYGSATDPYSRSRGLFHVIHAQALQGRYRSALSRADERLRFSKADAQAGIEAETYFLLARIALDRGDAPSARDNVKQALRLPLDPVALSEVGAVAARSGQVETAEEVLGRLNGLAERTSRIERLIRTLEGEIALARGDTKLAVDVLTSARSLTTTPSWSEPLARALLLDGDLDGARSEYAKIVNGKGPVFMQSPLWGPPTYAESVFHLAQIDEPSGNLEGAARLYRTYLDLRKHADDDVREVRISQQELAEITK